MRTASAFKSTIVAKPLAFDPSPMRSPVHRWKLLALCIAGSCLWISVAHGQAMDRKVEQAIKHRKSAFVLMSTYFSRLLQTVKKDRPYDARQTIADARTVEFLSSLPWEGFAPGTEKGDTKARDDIWFEEEKFKVLAAELQLKTKALVVATETQDLARIALAFERVRDTCSACHKAFRKD